jgi:hypothetical protein
MVHVYGKFELEDIKAAQALHARAGKTIQWILYILMAGVLITGVWSVMSESRGGFDWSLMVFPLVLAGVFALSWFVLRPIQVKRLYTQNKELSSQFEMTLAEMGYAITNSYGSAVIPWKDYAKWKADDKIILLYRSDNMFNMVPKRLLNGEGDTQFIMEQLKANNVKEASQVRNPIMTTARLLLWFLVVAIIVVLIYLTVR